MSQITSFFNQIFQSFTILSAIDILIMTFIIYAIIRLIKGTQAEQVAKGIIIILVITQVSDWIGLVTVNFVFKNIITVGLLALLIMFQPELRKMLETIGKTNVKHLKDIFMEKDLDSPSVAVDQIVESVSALSKTKTGLLVVIERQVPLDDVVETGVKLDSLLSTELLNNIFQYATPLHDGAVIINSETLRIRAAACLLPLSQNKNLSTSIGTRHRAGIGISEHSDCVSLMVSEENGVISYAIGGKLSRFVGERGIRRILTEILIEEPSHKNGKSKMLRRKNSDGKK